MSLSEVYNADQGAVAGDLNRPTLFHHAQSNLSSATPASINDMLGLLTYFVRTSSTSVDAKNPGTFWEPGASIKMEQAKRLELSTSTLARWCSTN